MKSNIRTFGGAIGTAAMTSVITSGTDRVLPDGASYTLGYGLLAIAALAAVGTACFMPFSRRSPSNTAMSDPRPP